MDGLAHLADRTDGMCHLSSCPRTLNSGSRSGSSESQLTKTDPVSGVIRWETYRKEGLQLLRTLAAEDADRQNILGPDTEWIGKLLEHGIPRDQVSPVEAGSAEPSVAPVEEAPLAVKRPRSPSPLPSSFDVLPPDGTVDADRRPMKRERSQSVVIKTEMDVDGL